MSQIEYTESKLVTASRLQCKMIVHQLTTIKEHVDGIANRLNAAATDADPVAFLTDRNETFTLEGWLAEALAGWCETDLADAIHHLEAIAAEDAQVIRDHAADENRLTARRV